MLALTEFGISENSSNYHLVEVSGFAAKTLHPDTTNLAERIGLASRYYIKNVMSSDQLIPEDVATELAKESKVDLIQLNPLEVAIQLMVEDFTIFRYIHKPMPNYMLCLYSANFSISAAKLRRQST